MFAQSNSFTALSWGNRFEQVKHGYENCVVWQTSLQAACWIWWQTHWILLAILCIKYISFECPQKFWFKEAKLPKNLLNCERTGSGSGEEEGDILPIDFMCKKMMVVLQSVSWEECHLADKRVILFCSYRIVDFTIGNQWN